MDAHEAYWAEQNPAVVFIMGLQDLNQPYSCEQWGNQGVSGAPVIVEHDGHLFDLFHDSWNAFPTYVLIDHTMTVRAKPWTYNSNSNTNPCDGSNNSVNGWSGGDTDDFLQQLVDECGDICIDGGCTTAAGDLNEDEILNIQDLITLVNQILGATILEGCPLEAADMNIDGIINIQDLISLVNAILGSARLAQMDGHGEVKYIDSEQDMIIHVDSDVDVAGIQLSLISDLPIAIELKDNRHINQESHFQNGITRYLAYSMFNQPFDSRNIEILIKSSGRDITRNDIEVTVADINGDALYLSYSKNGQRYQSGPHSFELAELYPNPFNPSTEVSFSLPMDGHVKLAAYDIKGQQVDMIFEGAQSLGEHSYTWNAANLPSGVYYIRLQSGTMVTSQKALLIK
jgi:hypothetical protein